MQMPLIGVTISVNVGQTPERVHLNTSYLRAVQDAGGVPIMLPPYLDPAVRRELWARLDGIVLSGGGDIDPARFGEEPHPAVYDVSPERDELELELCDEAFERELPLFAICRGVQVLNVARGGSLWQHVPDRFGPSIAHSQSGARDQATHPVTVSGETRLAEIVGSLDLRVNSFHHQALKALGKGVREVAWAPDGVVEAIEIPDAAMPVIGVQWHPEDLVRRDPAAANLFRALVDAARRRAARR